MSSKPKTTSKTASNSKAEVKPKKKDAKVKPAKVVVDVPAEDENSESSDEDDEAGMERLVELLGENGLDELAQEQLGLLRGQTADTEDEEGSEEDEDGSDDDGSESKLGEDGNEEQEQDVQDSEAEEAVDLEDVSEFEDEDAVPRQKLVINQKDALERIRELFKLDASLPWTETLAVTYDSTIDVDVNDDLQRELAIYKQALHGAQTARTLAKKASLPFTRPSDYFAEMVKSDSHMERIRHRLLDEHAQINKSEEKRKEREAKKFGKKVQVEKQKEREKSKKDLNERIKGLKRKRKDTLDAATANNGADFDVEVEDAINDRPSKRQAVSNRDGKPTVSRAKRDAKFGFGGKVGRRAKQNTKESTDAFLDRKGKGSTGFGGAKGGKGKGAKFAPASKKRPGKERRVQLASKRK